MTQDWRFYETQAGEQVAQRESRTLGDQAESALLTVVRAVMNGTASSFRNKQLDDGIYAVTVPWDGRRLWLLHAPDGRGGRLILAVGDTRGESEDVTRVRRLLSRARQRLSEWQRR